jgi:hypothetical protein
MTDFNKDGNIILHAVQYNDVMTVVHDGMTTGQKISASTAKKADKTTPPIPSWTDNGTRWAWWGDNDLLPTEMRQKVEAVPIAGATLARKIDMLQGNGIVYFNNADMAKGPNVDRAHNQVVEDFLTDNRIQEEWFAAQCADYCLPYNSFSELIMSRDQKMITGLYHVSAEHARLSKANARNEIDYLVYSMHYAFGTAQNDLNRIAIPLYKWYDREKFFNDLQGKKFAWHTRFPTPGLIYYARAWWLGLFKKKGWLDVSAQVPLIVQGMQTNQVALKYIIAIPEAYFIIRHADWHGYDNDRRQELIDAKVKDINDYLTGPDALFKSIAYVFKENEVTGLAMGKIEITAVDDKAKSGTWVPDSYAADAQIVQGFGMDPSQIGLAPQGGKMGAGSGSDKRESYNLMITLNTPDQRRILEPLNFISRFNKWGVTFAVDHTAHTTTNAQESGLQPSGQSTIINPSGNPPSKN